MSEPDPSPPSAPTKVLDTFTEEFEIGNRLISFETGKLARFANGAVVMAMEETKVLSTVTCAQSDGSRDFLPLTVGAGLPIASIYLVFFCTAVLVS